MEFLSAKILTWLERALDSYGIALLAGFMAFAMASVRTKWSNGQFDWLEAMMCSFMTIGLWSFLGTARDYFEYNIDEKAIIGVGVFLSFVGARYIFNLLDKALDKFFRKAGKVTEIVAIDDDEDENDNAKQG